MAAPQVTAQVTSKDEKYTKAAEAIFHLLLQAGIPAVTHARVSRSSKISRGWLYKYIGKNREDLITFGIDYFGKIFIELDVQAAAPKNKQEFFDFFVAGTERMLSYTLIYPWIIPIYFQFRASKSVVGERIRKISDAYLTRQMKELQPLFKIDAKEARICAEVLGGMRLGLGFNYQVTGLHQKIDGKTLSEAVGRFIKI